MDKNIYYRIQKVAAQHNQVMHVITAKSCWDPTNGAVQTLVIKAKTMSSHPTL